jgi:hypothetical protein
VVALAKWSRNTVLVVLLTPVVGLAAAVSYLLRDPEPRFIERRSALVSAREDAPVRDGESELRTAHLTAASGLAVDVTVRRAVCDSGRRLPLVLILGGHLTGADAARLVGETPGQIVAAMS